MLVKQTTIVPKMSRKQPLVQVRVDNQPHSNQQQECVFLMTLLERPRGQQQVYLQVGRLQVLLQQRLRELYQQWTLTVQKQD